MESVGTNKDNKGKKKQRLIVLVVLLLIMVGYFTWLVKEKPLKKEPEEANPKPEEANPKPEEAKYVEVVPNDLKKGLTFDERKALATFSDGLPYCHFYVKRINIYKNDYFNSLDQEQRKMFIKFNDFLHYGKKATGIESYKLRLPLYEYNRNMRLFNGSEGQDDFNLFLHTFRGVENNRIRGVFDFSKRVGSCLYFSFEKDKGVCLNFSKGLKEYDLLCSIPLSELYVFYRVVEAGLVSVTFVHVGSYDKEKQEAQIINKVELLVWYEQRNDNMKIYYSDGDFIFALDRFFKYFFYRLDDLK